MYIQPNTNIRILKNVPLDTSYDHTIWFESASDQSTYFISKQKYNLTNYTYQRVNSGVMRVGIEADNLYDCNYLMFQNTSFGNKWFYAFITEVNYINNDVAEIKYDMDDIQTWLFDFTFDECFVQREHTETDNVYEHYEAEPVDVGEYVQINFKKLMDETDYPLVLVVQFTQVDVHIAQQHLIIKGPKTYDNCPQGCVFMAFKNTTTGLNTLGQILDQLITDQNIDTTLINMYMIIDPGLSFNELDACFVPTDTNGLNTIIDGTVANNMSLPKNGDFSNVLLGGENLDPEHGVNTTAYKPKNNKLYTYPYNFCSIFNGCGDSLSLRYEFGTDNSQNLERGTFGVKVVSNITAPVQTILAPINYKNVNNNTGGTSNYETGLLSEQITITNYPVCSWAFDAYKMWASREVPPILTRAVADMGRSSIGLINNPYDKFTQKYENRVSGAKGGIANSIVSTASEFISQGYVASYNGTIAKGNANVGGALMPNKALTFFSARTTITAQRAKIIDDFFTMFGYAVNRCKTPNRSSRPHWNYVKTVGCCVQGSIPCDSMKHICDIHDKGITYWKSGDDVGNYSLDNSPVTPT